MIVNRTTNTAISGPRSEIGRRMRLIIAGLRNLADEASLFHMKPDICLLIIAVVMRNGDHRDAALLQSAQKFRVELPAEDRILVRRPFIEDADRSPFKQGYDQSQPLSLWRTIRWSRTHSCRR